MALPRPGATLEGPSRRGLHTPSVSNTNASEQPNQRSPTTSTSGRMHPGEPIAAVRASSMPSAGAQVPRMKGSSSH
ncbi:MAG TPA: hypothetical protein VFN61_15705, partial [Acidimicrobiales bacterium]|nr:hypothetical protein [Acidimicrobiales bacterium]